MSDEEVYFSIDIDDAIKNRSISIKIYSVDAWADQSPIVIAAFNLATKHIFSPSVVKPHMRLKMYYDLTADKQRVWFYEDIDEQNPYDKRVAIILPETIIYPAPEENWNAWEETKKLRAIESEKNKNAGRPSWPK